jgi:hypothetical protein
LQEIYGVLCLLDRHRGFIDRAEPDLYERLCPRILCSSSLARANDVIAGLPEAEGLLHIADFGAWQVGGWDPGSDPRGICERCTDLRKPGLIFPVESCWKIPPSPIEEECKTIVFQDDFEADAAGNSPATSPAGAPPDDSLTLLPSMRITFILVEIRQT